MEGVIPGAAAETRVAAVEDETHVGEVRRLAGGMARSCGFDEEDEGRVAVVVTELGTNLVKHARGGMVMLRALRDGRWAGLEILALDRGPGIADIATSLHDGFSTASTAGNGLGAVRRMAGEFDIHSRPPSGTAVLARMWPRARVAPGMPAALAVGAVCVPHPGESVSGDDWDLRATARGCQVMVADGLGHGPLAREAALSALSVFRTASPDTKPSAVVEDCHAALRATRGAAIALADVDAAAGSLRYAGVGNIATALFDGHGRSIQSAVSMNGTVGLGSVRAREFTYPWPADGILVMASDGISTRWSLAEHPGLAARDPAIIAAVLFRDHARGRDDATVVVVKGRRP
jgi:anti-sigma regulatory factor (Ser/Thr protein kinase)